MISSLAGFNDFILYPEERVKILDFLEF